MSHHASWPTRLRRTLIAPLTDKPDYELSLTRLLALFFAALIWHMVEAGHSLSVTQLTLALAIFAVAFGKSTFTFFLARNDQKIAEATAEHKANKG